MPRHERVLALLLCLAPLAGSSQPSLEPVRPETGVLRIAGFDVRPPGGNHWFFYRKRPPGQVTFRKQDPARIALPGGEHLSFIIEFKAEMYRNHDLTTRSGLEEALKYAIYESPDRYSYAQPDFKHFGWQDTDCVSYSTSREEPQDLDGQQVMFLWSVEGYFCRHPFEAKAGVIGFFQERRLSDAPSMLDDRLRNDANEVLSSLRFTPIR